MRLHRPAFCERRKFIYSVQMSFTTSWIIYNIENNFTTSHTNLKRWNELYGFIWNPRQQYRQLILDVTIEFNML